MLEHSEYYSKLVETLRQHHEFYRQSIPLIASENLASLAVRSMYLTDFGHRYAEGRVGKRFYQGCQYIDVVEDMAIQLTKEIFNAEHANVQPISGVTANIAAFFALTSPGDKLMALSVPCGGHISHDRFSAAGIRGLEVLHYPFDMDNLNVDVDETRKVAEKEKPKVFVLGSSLILFPHPVKEIAEIAAEIGARVVYDGSHVLGLIAGKQFQDPVKEGADVITASTHKTFFGPQRAIILCKAELAKKIDNAVFPGVVSNHHLHSLAGYVIACLEMLEFGEAYARQIVRNAKRLAERMHELGFNVVGEHLGFTESHQVAVDVTEFGGGDPVAKLFERINIILNKNLLPWDDLTKTKNPSGIRIGVQEITRLGMKEGEMEKLAEIMWDAVNGKKSEDKLRQEVIELKKEFNTIKYAFEETEAYTFFENFLSAPQRKI
ncbi:serine hydroxymethyltransferase [Archaeoglobus veneficus]|uniref:Serine hydroxymethyltransferase n=1 Tax=Archaeoglobus veneficus (strain DSM 11195 / SNP6) TaxID=693661 RepID=F2KT78_ARCVS|nr:serine hydroxymethyltransferase [Archaeoglobus veneficus]AEA47108.1 Glycine hydroxymethyltransferase [Archaeoglobus veneficus SNP6]